MNETIMSNNFFGQGESVTNSIDQSDQYSEPASALFGKKLQLNQQLDTKIKGIRDKYKTALYGESIE